MDKKRHTAIVLAAGQGLRMNSEIPKQFMEWEGRPLICHSLQVFENSFVDEIILVASEDRLDYCGEEIVEKYGYTKVTQIIAGGRERYDSVYQGLCAVRECDYVYIHDGARPFVDEEILLRAKQCVEETDACAAGMPVKDTIKVVDEQNVVIETPSRSRVWQIQTPQVFAYPLLKEAYDKLFAGGDFKDITDDAMVVERMLGHPVRLFEGSYRNVKITTPDDLNGGKR